MFLTFVLNLSYSSLDRRFRLNNALPRNFGYNEIINTYNYCVLFSHSHSTLRSGPLSTALVDIFFGTFETLQLPVEAVLDD